MQQTIDKESVRCFFDQKAADWDQHNTYNSMYTAAVLNKLHIPPRSRILDLACGTGVLFPQLLNLNPSLLHAVDLSAGMVHIASRKATDPRIEVFESDFYCFDKTGYDFIVMYNAYPHFPDKRGLAFKMKKSLRAGGRMLILHSSGKERINACHGRCPQDVAVPLLSCAQEMKYFLPHFLIDLFEDARERYYFSGTVC